MSRGRGGQFTFAQVPTADIPRSSFNRSHGHKTTFNAGYLIPVFVDEALPGDTFDVSASLFARLATPIVPIMDNLHMDVFFFAVPNRLIWDNWQRFMGEQPNPGDSIDFLVPEIVAGSSGFAVESLFDYMGIPPGIPNLRITALHARAYNLIFNEWFRDENLVNRVTVNKDDGPDPVAHYSLMRRGKRHDYFTSCLPWPQKGEGVELPLGGTIPVTISPTGDGIPSFTNTAYSNVPLAYRGGGTNDIIAGGIDNIANESLGWYNPKLAGVGDLGQATVVTINSLRQAFQIQKLLERDARGGTRYVEILRSHFGVVSPDSRLQRPEFLGGGSIPVNINPVTQTSGTPTDTNPVTKTPQGNLAAYGVTSGRVGFSKSFVEHCVIIGLVNVRADLSYQQGVSKMFSRRTRYDYYWPAFAHLGEQAVLNREIYAQGTATDDEVFGYQERWAEYRYKPSLITGKMRSGIAGGSLDNWHLAQNFLTLPTLNEEFISENPPVERVIAVVDEPHFIFDSHFAMRTTRPMPVYSVPGFTDHF